ncbi:hypothetical protein PQX77_005812 [Marasmius sp. AFHP31]|nr:hypothetical protein PQX77_005812 [Marasmius sp. AFHP31]
MLDPRLSKRKSGLHAGKQGDDDVDKGCKQHQEELRELPTPPLESESSPGTSLNPKQEREKRKIGSPRKRTDVSRDIRPQMTRQLPKVPEPCAGK